MEDFETYWRTHREQLLRANEEYRRVEESYKMKSGADWLLFGIPFFAGVLFMSACKLESELLKWLLSAGVTIVFFIVCVWLKGVLSGERSLSEIEDEVKAVAQERWMKENNS